MKNPYITEMKPQDLSGMSPTYQNIANQQAMQAAALAQQNQLMQAAGQTAQGPSPLALAAALRKDKKDPTKSLPIIDKSEEIPDGN